LLVKISGQGAVVVIGVNEPLDLEQLVGDGDHIGVSISHTRAQVGEKVKVLSGWVIVVLGRHDNERRSGKA
jgi:hypothetical protein